MSQPWEFMEFRTQLEAMPDEFLKCRDVRHHWETIGGFQKADPNPRWGGRKLYARVAVCNTCGARRQDLFYFTKADGMVKLSSHYRSPSGYAFKHASGIKKKNNHVRAEVFRRQNNA